MLTNKYGDNQREIEAQQQAAEQRRLDELLATEKRKEDAKLKALQIEQRQYWGICRRAMKKRLSYFEGLEIISSVPPQPLINDQIFTFRVDFTAISQARKPLNYNCLLYTSPSPRDA